MFEKIVYINDRFATIRLTEGTSATINLMNLHIIFEDDYKTILGEVDDLDGDLVKVRFLGEIVQDRLLGGVIRKPSLDSRIRVISEEEIPFIVGSDEKGFIKLGVSPFYNDYPVYLDVNNFFSNHFAVFGNSGSGKSCGVSRLFQNMFHDERLFPYKANILLFDSSGEYCNAFSNLTSINTNYHYRYISTNEINSGAEKLRIPIFLLNVNDLALLLQATSHSQIPMIERMLKLALVFSQNDNEANDYKNYLIAKAIMTVLYTNETAPNKRNEIFSILASCSTAEFNLEAELHGVGYKRKFRECFLIDNQGQFTESVLLTDYVTSFIKSEFESYEPYNNDAYYTLETLEKALNFTLISEGWLRNENTYADAITLKVRLHSLIVGENAKYFDYPNFVSLETYLSSLIIDNGMKYQIVNINLDDVDDDFAKVITKIFSRLIFDFSKGLPERASIPFHIVIEESHRYVQDDNDRFLLGYNIFERIAKEGRKYGVVLGLISQRPVELSETVISQCSNFMIFKINHPVDVEYIRKMVPNISDEIVEKQKSLQSGTCLGFGMAFRIPLIVKMEMPNPSPWSANCDVVTIWNGNTASEPIPMRREMPVTQKTQVNSANNYNQVIQEDIKSDIVSDKLRNIDSKVQDFGNKEKTKKVKHGEENVSNEKKEKKSLLKKVKDEDVENKSFIDNQSINSNNNKIGVLIPSAPTGNKIEIPKVPRGMSPDYMTVSDNEFIPSKVSGDLINTNDQSNNVAITNPLFNQNGFIEMSNSMDLNDNLLSSVGEQKQGPRFGDFEINSGVQSAIPDFTTTSEQERRMGIPTNTYEIPDTYSLINQSSVKPTVAFEETSDYGSVRVVPPQDNMVSGGVTPMFNLNNKGNSGGIPTTDSGVPLINIVG